VTVLTLAAYWLSLLFEGKTIVHKVLSNGAFAAASFLFWPFKFLDALLARKPGAHRLAFGVYCTAQKTGPG
jgi:hypothetical protein